MRLSPPGSSLYVPLILTSFSHCYYYLQLSSYAHYYKSCVWKCQCKVCVSTNGLKTPELQLWGFCSFASIVDTNHIIFAYRHYSICRLIMQYYNNIIIITAWSAFLPRSDISQLLLSSSDAPWTRYRKMRLIPKCSAYRLEQLRSPFRHAVPCNNTARIRRLPDPISR